jgi:hypothetical protein
MDEMRDPGEILLMSPSDDGNDVYAIPQNIAGFDQNHAQNMYNQQYQMPYQDNNQEYEGNDEEEPDQMPETYSQNQFGYNPESLYSQSEDMDDYRNHGKENMRQPANQNSDHNHTRSKRSKATPHDRLAKHKFVSESGNKKCNRTN